MLIAVGNRSWVNTHYRVNTKFSVQLFFYILVVPQQNDLSLEGITDEIVKVGTLLQLTCVINRIKPEAAEMYWMVNGRKENGAITSTTNGDTTSKQTNTLQYT